MKPNPFAAKLPFKVSRAALGLILSTLFLAGLLTFSTLQNINREQAMIERFLRQNGETTIKAIEAAMRTSMMHHMGESDALYTLLNESSRASDIVFIIVTDKNGKAIGMKSVCDHDDLMVMSTKGMVVRAAVKDLRATGRAAQGVKVINLKGGDKVATMTCVEAEDDDAEA